MRGVCERERERYVYVCVREKEREMCVCVREICVCERE